MYTKIKLFFTFFRLFLSDLFKSVRKCSASEPGLNERLNQSLSWLKKSQDVTGNGGFSQGFYLYRHGHFGWLPSYRETSGYIVETFFNIYSVFGDRDAFERSIKASEWLLSVQNEDGSISNPNFGKSGIVFDTGQVLFGFIRAYKETNEKKYLSAAKKAGKWLCEVASPESGIWEEYTHNNCFHAYNTRVAWALLELNEIWDEEGSRLKYVATSNLDKALKDQTDGWFQKNAFTSNSAPYTHNIAYAIRGMLESGLLLDNESYIQSAILAAEKILSYMETDGFIPGRIDEKGKADTRFCCLTGNSQLSIIWYKLYRNTNNSTYLNAAEKSISYVSSCSNFTTKNNDLRGSIKGSDPIFGRYTPMGYPNWATKFFIDALLLKMEIEN